MKTRTLLLIGMTVLLLGALAFALQTSTDTSATSTGDATATKNEDGTIVVSGVTLPSQSVSVPADCEAETTQTAKVVCSANAFLDTLSEDQKAEVLLPLTQENAVRWSNFPSPFGQRNGIQLGTLDEAQQAAAEAVVKVAMGTVENEGYSEAMQIRMADDVLALFDEGGGAPGEQSGGASGEESGGTPPNGATASSGGSGGPGGGGAVVFSSGSYYLAFLGTPSTTDTWIFQFGGHHLAVNTTYEAGEVASPTPMHTGVEPTSWTTEDGATYAPLSSDHDGLVAMFASLSDDQLAAAQLSESFSDVLLGPGQDGQFPATKEGLAVSSLSDEQKALVLAAMKPWVQDADEATAEELLAVYEQELDDTYIAFSGDPSLSDSADYARIDGPSVWIELACQNSDIDPSGIHYHTIWRDHTRDYGAEFNF